MTSERNFAADPSHDVLRGEPNPLDVIFRPKSIAVIGATEREGSVGRTVVENLVKGGFAGTLCGVNPHRREVLGVPTYPSLADAPGKVDLAVVVTPAVTVPGVIRECGAAGVGGAVIISAGFKEVGAAGAQLEQEALAEARRGKVRLIGPNCLGVMNPFAKLNATFAQSMALEGSRRSSQPERRAVHRYPRLELAGKCRLQRVRFHRLDARRWLGRPDRLLWR